MAESCAKITQTFRRRDSIVWFCSRVHIFSIGRSWRGAKGDGWGAKREHSPDRLRPANGCGHFGFVVARDGCVASSTSTSCGGANRGPGSEARATRSRQADPALEGTEGRRRDDGVFSRHPAANAPRDGSSVAISAAEATSTAAADSSAPREGCFAIDIDAWCRPSAQAASNSAAAAPTAVA